MTIHSVAWRRLHLLLHPDQVVCSRHPPQNHQYLSASSWPSSWLAHCPCLGRALHIPVAHIKASSISPPSQPHFLESLSITVLHCVSCPTLPMSSDWGSSTVTSHRPPVHPVQVFQRSTQESYESFAHDHILQAVSYLCAYTRGGPLQPSIADHKESPGHIKLSFPSVCFSCSFPNGGSTTRGNNFNSTIQSLLWQEHKRQLNPKSHRMH